MTFPDFTPDPKRIRVLKIFLIATLVAGVLAGGIAKPLSIPIPYWAIAPAWTLSYILMAVAAWLAWTRPAAGLAMALYTTQLALNLGWRFWPTPLLGMAMDLAMLATLILFARRNLVAALTFLPCMAWSLFVSVPISGL